MRTLSAAMTAELARRTPSGIRAHLLDVQRADGKNYFWSDFECNVVSKLTGSPQQYKPWIKQAPTIKMTRSLQSDGGDVILQNLSGNTIDREVAALFAAGEFEGAYVIYRPWRIPLDAAPWEFHGSITEPSVDTEEITFRILQLFQPNDLPSFDERQERSCHWRYRSPRCGYRRGDLLVPLTTATAFSANTIGASGLTLTPNLFRDEVAMIISGTGAAQERFILSHTATTFTTKTNWTTNPDGTSKFIITGPGTMKLASTFATIFTNSTIGNGALARTVNGDVDGAVYIISGTGAGQNRAIVSNTATVFTVTPNWTTNPDGTSIFIVVYRECDLDRASCVARGVIERFAGVIFLQSQITAVTGPTGVGTGGNRGGGGGGGGRGGSSRDPMRTLD